MADKRISAWGNLNTFEFLRADGTAPLVPGQAPSLGGVQGGTPALAWSTQEGIYVQFLDPLGEPDTDPLFARVHVTTGNNATNVQIVDALETFAVGWQDGSDIKFRGVAQEIGTVGSEMTIANAHAISISGYSFATGVPDPADNDKTLEVAGVDVAWVDGANTFGPIMLQRYQLTVDALGHPAGFAAAGIDGQIEATATRTAADQAALNVAFSGTGGPNDNAILVAAEGRDPKVTSLHTGDTLVTWIDQAGAIHGRLYPPNGAVVPSDAENDVGTAEYNAVNAQLATLGTIAPDNGGERFNVQVVELGPAGFAVVWVVRNGGGQYGLDGWLFATPPDTPAGGALPDGWQRYDIQDFFPAGFAGEFALTGFGEDNTDLAITYTANDGNASGIFARVIDTSGINGNPNSLLVVNDVRVNVTTAGEQHLSATSGLISDRFMVSWVDDNGVVQSRIMDTREPGVFFVGDDIRDRNDNGVIDAGDRIRARPDVFVGTNGDDIIIGDLVNPNIPNVRFDDPLGADDQLFGGLGNDIIFGGGGHDIIDGGFDLDTQGQGLDPELGLASAQYGDRALFRSNLVNVNIFINGDGSYSVLDARFDDGDGVIDGIRNGPQNIDGWDIVANVETLQFMQGDDAYIRAASYASSLEQAKLLLSTIPSTHLLVRTADLYHLPGQDQRLTGNVTEANVPDNNPVGIETVFTPVGWALSDPSVAANGFAVASTAAVETAPLIAAAIEGFVTAWEIPGVGASTVQMQVYDALGVPGDLITVTANATAGTTAIAGTGAGTVAAWVAADTGLLNIQAFDIANLPLGGLLTIPTLGPVSQIALASESIDGAVIGEQFTISWVESANIDGFGEVRVQRYGFPPDLAGEPTAPVPLGLDGNIGGDLDAPFVLAANGRAPGIAGLHDGEAAISYVTTDGVSESLNLTIINPAGQTVLTHTAFATAAAFVGNPFISSAGEGDIVIGYELPDGSVHVSVMRIGVGWQNIETVTLDLNDPSGGDSSVLSDLSFALAGEDDISLIVSWRNADGDVVAQRFAYAPGSLGDLVGGSFEIADNPDGPSSLAGMLDGRFTAIYGDNNDVSAHIYDTRSSEDPTIGRDAGGPRDFQVGTVFDDIIDGRDRADTIYGALGNDVLIGGIGDDLLFGGGGNDVLVGGTGTDTLSGDDGDDLLMPGYGRDYVYGGDGIDTLSYRGELRAVTVDLAAGTVRSDQNVNGVILPDAGLTITGPAAIINAIFNDRGLEDVLGQIIETNHELEQFAFNANHGIENVEGGMGNDQLFGDGGANELTGLGGDDLIDGRGGIDTAVFSGLRSDYVITQIDATTVRLVDTRGIDSGATGDVVRNVELFKFSNGTLTFAGLLAAPPPPPPPVGSPPVISGPATLTALNEDTSRILSRANFLQNVTDADGLNTLSVLNVIASIGTIVNNGNGTWTYTPPPNNDTSVVFSYQVTDGSTTLNHSASMDLIPQNDAQTGGVTIASVNGTNSLIASNDIQDPDGLIGPVTYRWQSSRNDGRTWTDIAGATAASFTPAGNALGALLRVVAVSTDSFGTTLTPSDVTAIIGTAGNERLDGNAGVNILSGMNGNDQLNGLAGDDFLYGGAGNDTLNGGLGADLMDGGAGNDSYVVDNVGDIVIEGVNGGTDTVSTSLNNYVLTANVENLTFTGNGANTGVGNDLANTITDGAGNGTFTGLGGNDTIVGGNGNDRFIATMNDGNDTYNGGNGIDTLDMSAITSSVTVNLGAAVTVAGTTFAANRATGAAIGTDTLVAIENAIGGSGADILVASNVRNEFTGGAGNDRFVFSSIQNAGNGAANRDLIRDFTSGDTIDIRGIDADTRAGAVGAGDQAFTFIGQTNGPIGGGQIGYHFEIIGGVEHTIVEGNIRVANNNTQVDFQIDLLGHVVLTASDFLL